MSKQSKQNFAINGKEIMPGEKQTLQLHVARLPSGTVINLRVRVFRSLNPGPTMLIMGGLHGDEINGVEIVRKALVEKYFDNLQSGSAIVIPLLNIYGFINFSRDASEGKDVNRSFPGSLSGSLASRVAATLTKKILPLVDFGVDFHTGGASRYNYPQIRYTLGHTMSRELALEFNAPFTIAKVNIQKTLRKSALNKGIPILVYEGGESLRLDGFSIQKGLEGLQRLMASRGLINQDEIRPSKTHHLNRTTWIRADRSGIFQWTKSSGVKVFKGEPMGFICDPYGENKIIVKAKRDGFVIGHNNAPVISQGDALFHIGFFD